MEKGDTRHIYRIIAFSIIYGLILASLMVLFLEFILDIGIRSRPIILLVIFVPLLGTSIVTLIFELKTLHKSKSEKEQSVFKFAMVLAKFIAILVGLQMLIILIFLDCLCYPA